VLDWIILIPYVSYLSLSSFIFDMSTLQVGVKVNPATSRYGSCDAAARTCSVRRTNKHISEMSVCSIPRKCKYCSFVQRPRRYLLFDTNWDGRLTEGRNQLKAANPGRKSAIVPYSQETEFVATCMLVLRDNAVDHYFEIQFMRQLIRPFDMSPWLRVTRTSTRRFQWPRDLRRRSAAPRLLGLWVRIPPAAWMPVSRECCVQSGRDFCDGVITRPEESYRVWRVWVWSRSLERWDHDPKMGRIATRRKDRKKENKANPRYSPFHTPTYLNAGAVITAFLIHLKCLEREIKPSYGGD
jgi:hypothetical protein